MNSISCLESGISSTLGKKHFKKSLKILESKPQSSILGKRKVNLAMVFAILSELNLNLDKVSLIEIGSHFTEYSIARKSDSGLFDSSIAHYFINCRDKYDYFSFDTLTDDRKNLKFVNLVSGSRNRLVEKINVTLEKNKIPIIFSNFVLGFNDEEFDSTRDRCRNPIFWNLPGIHMHQYLIWDLISRASKTEGIGKDFDSEEYGDLLLQKPDIEFDRIVSGFVKKTHSLDVPVYSSNNQHINSRSNALSIWLIKP